MFVVEVFVVEVFVEVSLQFLQLLSVMLLLLVLVLFVVFGLFCIIFALLVTSGSAPNTPAFGGADLDPRFGPDAELRAQCDGKTFRQILASNGGPIGLCFDLGCSPHRGRGPYAKQSSIPRPFDNLIRQY